MPCFCASLTMLPDAIKLLPEPDSPGEDPWTDICVYSNPIFIQVQ